MLSSIIIQLIKIFLLITMVAHEGFCKEFIDLNHNHKQTLKISADNTQIFYKKGLVLLEGNVETIQGNITIKSEKMRINFSFLKNKDWKIGNIFYNGKVTLSSPMHHIKSDIIRYNLLKNELIIEGNVIINKDKNQINSEKLLYDLKKDLIIMTGSSTNKTRAIINIE